MNKLDDMDQDIKTSLIIPQPKKIPYHTVNHICDNKLIETFPIANIGELRLQKVNKSHNNRDSYSIARINDKSYVQPDKSKLHLNMSHNMQAISLMSFKNIIKGVYPVPNTSLIFLTSYPTVTDESILRVVDF